TLAVNVAVMTAALYVVLAYLEWGIPELVKSGWDAPARDPALIKAVGLIFVELTLITAIALFFSTFSTPILSAVFTFSLFVAGHLSAGLRDFALVVDSPVAAHVSRALYWILPNLAQFDIKAQVVHGQPVPFAYLALTTGYAAVYIAMLLVAATF